MLQVFALPFACELPIVHAPMSRFRNYFSHVHVFARAEPLGTPRSAPRSRRPLAGRAPSLCRPKMPRPSGRPRPPSRRRVRCKITASWYIANPHHCRLPHCACHSPRQSITHSRCLSVFARAPLTRCIPLFLLGSTYRCHISHLSSARADQLLPRILDGRARPRRTARRARARPPSDQILRRGARRRGVERAAAPPGAAPLGCGTASDEPIVAPKPFAKSL